MCAWHNEMETPEMVGEEEEDKEKIQKDEGSFEAGLRLHFAMTIPGMAMRRWRHKAVRNDSEAIAAGGDGWCAVGKD